MSRVGKLPISLPQGVSFSFREGLLEVKGPKGTLKRQIHPAIDVVAEGTELRVLPRREGQSGALWGLFRSLVQNMVTGVSVGFTKILEVTGVGWRVDEESPGVLKMALGYSHPVIFKVPQGVAATVEAKAGRVTLVSIDNELLGQTAATIRAFRPPEPYKGKGIRYAGEVIQKKVGKAGAK
ncbi:MAG: 50S ribosomal protein L6 [Deltaproteobacteria bacterium]|jgi:large subunit ribosomal protein L6|nr:50S ribosomal protein L6 [Deltaproteobacteria bacterium]